MNFEKALGGNARIGGLGAPGRARRRWLWIGLVVVVLLVGCVLVYRMTIGGATEKPKGGAAATQGAQGKGDGQLPAVTVVVPGLSNVEQRVSVTGNLAARREMPVGIVGSGGLVVRVLVEPGDWVKAGQVLAEIDRSVQAQSLAALAAQVRVAEADSRLAEAELKRAQSLVARGFISKADIERKTATRDAALARVRVQQAQLAQARADTARLDIRAPAAGLILTRSVEPGQVVAQGSGTLFRIARDGEFELQARLGEAELVKMRPDLPAQVTPVGGAQQFAGRIWQISPVIDPQSRQGTVRIALAYNTALRPGGFATAEIIAGTTNAPLLPESAVLSDAKGSYVYVIGQGDKVERRGVTVGDVSDAGVSILAGLTGNERVVMSAGAFLNPGEKVIPKLANGPRA